MSTPADPNEPTRVDLPEATAAGEPTRPLDPAIVPGDPLPPEAGRPPLPDDGDDRRRAAWLWALLAAVLIGLVLFALLQGDDDDDELDAGDAPTETTAPPQDTAAPEEEVSTTTTAPPVEEEPTTSAPTTSQAPAAPGAGTDGEGAVTTEDGTDLLGLLQGDEGDAERLAPYAGSDVTGTGVEVLEVVEGEGFWIGTDEQRIFAHGSDELATTVEAGQRIDFEGVLEANPPADSADVHDIPEDQGAELHGQQGHHIEMRSITPAA